MTTKLVRTNLHNHTNISDGSDDPKDSLMALVMAVHYGTISDHDTTTGWEKKILKDDFITNAFGIEQGPGYFTASRPSFFQFSMHPAEQVRIYQGIELTIAHAHKDGHPKSVHLIGLGIDPPTPPVRQKLEALTRYRYERLQRMTDEINQKAAGAYNEKEISPEEKALYAGVRIPWYGPNGVLFVTGESESPTKLHIGIALSIHGYGVPRSCMQKYVQGLESAAFDHNYLYPAKEGIDTIKVQLRGAAGLAHPKRTAEDLGMTVEELVEQFVPLGISFLDANSNRDIEDFRELAKKYGLFITGGADTHGKHDEGWRVGPPYIDLPYENVERLDDDIARAKHLRRLDTVNPPHL